MTLPTVHDYLMQCKRCKTAMTAWFRDGYEADIAASTIRCLPCVEETIRELDALLRAAKNAERLLSISLGYPLDTDENKSYLNELRAAIARAEGREGR